MPSLMIGSTVYPACAGIDPERARHHERRGGLPRMRGDRPSASIGFGKVRLFTPHARGSTYLTLHGDMLVWVYPACAGIDPLALLF